MTPHDQQEESTMIADTRIEAAARQVAVERGFPADCFPDGMFELTAKRFREQAARIVAAADRAAELEALGRK